MNKELTQKLTDKYPQLFSKIKRVYCPDGWFHIIDITCALMQGYMDRNKHDDSAKIAFTNINHHLGELTMFYTGGRGHDYLNEVRDNAKRISTTICQETGGPGAKHRSPAGTIHTVSHAVAEIKQMVPIVPQIVVHDTRSSPAVIPEFNAVLASSNQ